MTGPSDPRSVLERLAELRIPRAGDLDGNPEMLAALVDRMNDFSRGCPMMVTSSPTSIGKELLRIETQDINNPKIRSISYVWPRPNQ